MDNNSIRASQLYHIELFYLVSQGTTMQYVQNMKRCENFYNDLYQRDPRAKNGTPASGCTCQENTVHSGWHIVCACAKMRSPSTRLCTVSLPIRIFLSKHIFEICSQTFVTILITVYTFAICRVARESEERYAAKRQVSLITTRAEANYAFTLWLTFSLAQTWHNKRLP